LNEITYKGYTLLEGPQNFFCLKCGVLPSFGFFRCDVNTGTLISTTLSDPEDPESPKVWETSGSLVLASDDDSTTLHHLWLVKLATSGRLTGVQDIVLADERIRWGFILGTQDFNTYTAEREADGNEYELTNLNTSVEWTYQDILDEIGDLLSVEFGNLWGITRKPRNFHMKGLPVPNALQRLLREVNGYLAVDLTTTSPTYKVYPLGTEDGDEITALAVYDDIISVSQEAIHVNPVVSRPATAEMLAAFGPSNIKKVETYGEATAIGGFGQTFIPSDYAALLDDVGAVLNATALNTDGDEITAEYKTSFGNTWRDRTYAGILSLPLNSITHEIVWQSNEAGAYTRIRSFRPKEIRLPGLQNGLFNYGDYPLPFAKFDLLSVDGSCVIKEDTDQNFQTEIMTNIQTTGHLQRVLFHTTKTFGIDPRQMVAVMVDAASMLTYEISSEPVPSYVYAGTLEIYGITAEFDPLTVKWSTKQASASIGYIGQARALARLTSGVVLINLSVEGTLNTCPQSQERGFVSTFPPNGQAPNDDEYFGLEIRLVPQPVDGYNPVFTTWSSVTTCESENTRIVCSRP